MIINYLKIAIRSLRKNKFISFVNLFGLTLGLTSCLLILAYFMDESSYDKYHENADRIYRVALNWTWKGGDIHSASNSGLVAPMLKQNFPEVENTTRFFAEGNEFVKTGNGTLEISPIFTENSFFKIFSHPFLYGDPNTALTDPNSLVITESLAKKVFGDAALALGNVLEYVNRSPQKITGVIKDVPRQSHLSFDAIGVLDTKADFVNTFHQFSLYTYMLLKKGANAEKLQSKLNTFLTTYQHEGEGDLQLPLQALTSIHLHSHLENELQANGDILYLYIFFMVAGVILLLACINYINLATAQSMKRAREVGIRKVMGSARWQLISQFFTESFLLVLCASLLSLLLMELLSPSLKEITGRQISLWQNGWPFVAGIMIVVAVIVGLLSGIYPAIFLSHFKPITVLKGVFASQPSNAIFRKSLVVFQFAISTALIVFSSVIYQQLNFAIKEDLGFTKDQVVGLRIPNYELRLKSLSAMKSQLLRGPGVLGSTATTNPLGNDNIGARGYFMESNGQKPDNTNMALRLGIDPDYLQVMRIPLASGRNFSPLMPSDSTESVIVNEAFVKTAGWKEAIGKRVWYNINGKKTIETKVIGVVKDFHVASLHRIIEPLIFFIASKEESDNIYVKIKPGNAAATMAFIEKTYRQFDNYNPFETYFLDQNFANQYKEDSRKGNLFLLFTSLAICIACLGLFGLAAFTVQQRTREIGIRKVLGASIQNLVYLLSKDFLLLMFIAFVIAIPIAWWISDSWLQDFAYRIHISGWLFLFAGFIALLVALLTVSFQAVKAAMMDPAKTLRNEV